MFRIKRVYEAAAPADGFRVLVDRLWPRGLSKEKAHIDLWLKEIAPSDELRRWAHSHPELWPEFERRYTAELDANGAAVGLLRHNAKSGAVTLLYARSDTERNHAAVLLQYLTQKA